VIGSEAVLRSPLHPKDARADVTAGRALALALEALGEALHGDPALPPSLSLHVAALAAGRSGVPADGERSDFPARVRSALAAPRAGGDGVATLEAWLGAALTAWLAETTEAGKYTMEVEAVLEAREALLARKRPIAAVYARWHGEGLEETAREVFRAASTIALGEAIDRWVALGCEGDLDRVVATWQRSSAGWAEKTLGTAIEVSVGDLGQLRALQRAVRAARAKTPEGLTRAVARRMGLSVEETKRLMALDACVRARRDPERVIRRRWAMVKPIAVAVATLERELGRMPSMTEIAARAGVHPCAVELVLEAMGGLETLDGETGEP
jgi:hypothetical protein